MHYSLHHVKSRTGGFQDPARFVRISQAQKLRAAQELGEKGKQTQMGRMGRMD